MRDGAERIAGDDGRDGGVVDRAEDRIELNREMRSALVGRKSGEGADGEGGRVVRDEARSAE